LDLKTIRKWKYFFDIQWYILYYIIYYRFFQLLVLDDVPAFTDVLSAWKSVDAGARGS